MATTKKPKKQMPTGGGRKKPRVGPLTEQETATLGELIAMYDAAGVDVPEMARRISRVMGHVVSASLVERRRLELRADLVRTTIAAAGFVATVNAQDLDRLDRMQQALFFKACGVDPVTLERNRVPSEAAAREVREIMDLRRQILGLDKAKVGALGSGNKRVTFRVMTTAEVEAARAEAARNDAIEGEIAAVMPALPAPVVDTTTPPIDGPDPTGDPVLDAAVEKWGRAG